MSSHFKSAVCASRKQLANVRTSAPARVMRTGIPSFIARHSKSVLTVSKEMMRQSMVSIASSPCV